LIIGILQTIQHTTSEFNSILSTYHPLIPPTYGEY